MPVVVKISEKVKAEGAKGHYMIAEAEMESEFEHLFPEDEIYFITSGSLLEIRQVTYTRGHNIYLTRRSAQKC